MGKSRLEYSKLIFFLCLVYYRIESYGIDNAQYEYKIENISSTRSLEEYQQEGRLVEQVGALL